MEDPSRNDRSQLNQNHISGRRGRLPPLRALQAFEAAARHGSVSLAADELNVTHSAVSHQLRGLESWLGQALFVRSGRGVELTEQGRLLMPVLRDAFDSMAAGVEWVTGGADGDRLTVQVYVTMAVKWLLPRLHSFEATHPDIRIAVATSFSQWGFARDIADAGIVFSPERVSDLAVTPLCRGRMIPVCSPELHAPEQPLARAEDLRRHRLIDVFTDRENWHRWQQAAGIADLHPSQLVGVDSYLLALEAALRGEGVALVPEIFALPDLEAGRLVRPLELSVPWVLPMCFVCPRERSHDASVVRFRDWLVARMADDAAVTDRSDS